MGFRCGWEVPRSAKARLVPRDEIGLKVERVRNTTRLYETQTTLNSVVTLASTVARSSQRAIIADAEVNRLATGERQPSDKKRVRHKLFTYNRLQHRPIDWPVGLICD